MQQQQFCGGYEVRSEMQSVTTWCTVPKAMARLPLVELEHARNLQISVSDGRFSASKNKLALVLIIDYATCTFLVPTEGEIFRVLNFGDRLTE